MRTIGCIWLFYRKLIIPLVSVSLAFAFLNLIASGAFSFKFTGACYIVLTPVFHFFIYEVGNPGEYYFYYNMGMNKLVLWVATTSVSLLTGLILMLL